MIYFFFFQFSLSTVIYARGDTVCRDEKYLAALRRAADLCWERGLLRKGPSICHGVAGTGYVFLLLYRLTRVSS